MSTSNYTNNNIDLSGIENLTNFSVFNTKNYLDPSITGYAFIFVTKPSLFIYPSREITDNSNYKETLAYQNMAKDPIIAQFIDTEAMNPKDRLIAEQLSYYTTEILNNNASSSITKGTYGDSYYRKSNFLPIFTNRAKNLETSDITMEQVEAFTTKQQYRETLPSFKDASQAAGTLNLPFSETSNLDFTKMMTIWVNYIANITDGTFAANPDMVRSGILDYMCSIYYFMLDPDGKTIKYWSKYTGCWPSVIPYSSLAYSKGNTDAIDVNLSFNYIIKEDMNPQTLKDFNKVSLNLSSILSENESTELYSPIKKSVYLMKSNLAQYSNTTGFRDPLVFYNDKSLTSTDSSTSLNNSFELSFSYNDSSNNYPNAVLGDNWYTSSSNFNTSDLDKNS